MSQKPIELILMRQLAGSLAMPIFLVDAHGALAFYNEPAEALLGMRFDETGAMPVSEWSTVWQPTAECGAHGPGFLRSVLASRKSRRRSVDLTRLDS